jgi:hypothetical protein
VVTAPSAFAQIMAEAVALADGLEAAQQFECTRLAAEPYLAAALALAGRTREQIETLDARLRALPPEEAYRPVQVFVETVYKHAIDPRGYSQPPQLHELPGEHVTRVSNAVLAMTCNDLGVIRMELAAVAALRATRDHPEAFAKGCADIAQHQEHLRAAHAKLRATLERAANSWTRSDIFYRSGLATFTLSGGAVHIGGGEGDVEAAERLLHWLRANREL